MFADQEGGNPANKGTMKAAQTGAGGSPFVASRRAAA